MFSMMPTLFCYECSVLLLTERFFVLPCDATQMGAGGLACMPKIHLLQAVPSPQWPHNKSVEGVAQHRGCHTGQQQGLDVRVSGEQHRELKAVLPMHERTPHNQTLRVDMWFRHWSVSTCKHTL